MRSFREERTSLNLAGKKASIDEPKHLQSKSYNAKEISLKIKKPRPPSHYTRPPSNYMKSRNRSVNVTRKSSPAMYEEDFNPVFKAIYN